MHQQNQNKQHLPVMLGEVLKFLDPQAGDSFLDLTAGYGGHAQKVLERTQSGSARQGQAVLVDRDQQAIVALGQQFTDRRIQIIHQDYLDAARELKASGRQFNLVLADLGTSSPHLNTASRGFSFTIDGPLDMRMDQRQAVTAAAIVNSYSQTELIELLRAYGEEPRAAKIARVIAEHRPFTGTAQLADLVARAVGRRGKNHPATRTFQALRIAVNNELDLLARALPLWLDLLEPEGRIAVISFHSLEDRLVKQALAERAKSGYEADLRLLTKRPVTPTREEIVFNPRARSACLRAAAKINIRKGS